MSEPEAAFMKLEIGRDAVIGWMRERPSPASRWTDWRGIGGQWYLGGGNRALADAPETLLRETLQEADQTLSRSPSNHALLGALIAPDLAPEFQIAAFDETGRTFVAGSLAYSESLSDFIVFLALARGAADRLAPAGHGLAIIQNVIWGDVEAKGVTAAIRMMPTGETQFLAGSERSSAGPAFQAIADAMLDGRMPLGFRLRNELEDLR